MRLQRHGQVKAPPQLLAARLQEIDRPRVHLDQAAILVAHEALRKCGLQIGRGRGKGGDRVAGPAVEIGRCQRQIGLVERLYACAQAKLIAHAFFQRTVAARQLRHEHALPCGIIEHGHIGRGNQRIGNLRAGRRSAVLIGGCQDLHRPYRLPAQSIAQSGQGAEVRKLLRRDVQVDSDVADAAQYAFGSTGQRHVDADLPATGFAAVIGVALDTRSHRPAFKPIC